MVAPLPVVEAGRRAAERRMTDTVRITRTDPDQVDELTGRGVDVTVYEGRAKVQGYTAYETRAEVAGATVVIQRSGLHLPVGAYRMRVGDVVEVTATATDPFLVGRRYRIAQEAPMKTHATAYRVYVDAVL